MDRFKEMDTDGSGLLDKNEARKAMQQLRLENPDSVLSDREMEFFLKAAAGDDGMIDLGKKVVAVFINKHVIVLH